MTESAAEAPSADAILQPNVWARRDIRMPRALGRRLGRSDRSPVAIWFWEIDRVLLGLVGALIAIGLVAVAAASPASAQRLSTADETLSPYYFLYRQIGWLIVGLPLMFGISMLPKQQARRLGIMLAAIFLFLLILVPFAGSTVNGAKRWIGYGLTLQPSEFLKPCFAILLGWILSWKARDPSLPVMPLAIGLTGLIAVLLMNQPDLGQTIMFAGIAMAIFLLAGLSLQLVGGMIGLGIIGMIAAYLFYPVATQRINGWLYGAGEFDQVMLAHRTLTSGGLVGTGPGLGTRKFTLPEAHTDYIFSVIGEEFGLLACAVIALLYFAIMARICVRLLEERDYFVLLAVTGLAAQFGGQAFINMAVNLQLFPSKGMTLPFISYGGSSLIALCMGMGFLLALTRRNPYLDRSLLATHWSTP